MIAALVLALPLWNASSSWFEMRGLAPRGRTIRTPTAELHFDCQGEGATPVVFEAGLGGTYLEFRPIAQRLTATRRVCTYDRAGLGWSGPSAAERTAAGAAGELLAATDALGMSVPFLVVAHSYGALVALEAVSQTPGRIAGLVLLDPSYPAETELEGPPPTTLASAMWLAAPAGLIRFREMFESLPPETPREKTALMRRTGHLLSFAREVQSIDASSRALRERLPQLGDKPVIVVSRSRAEGADLDKRHAEQRRLAAISTRGRFEVAPASGHFVYDDAPQAVNAAIEEALRLAVQGDRPPGPGTGAAVLEDCVRCGYTVSSLRMSAR